MQKTKEIQFSFSSSFSPLVLPDFLFYNFLSIYRSSFTIFFYSRFAGDKILCFPFIRRIF